MERGHGNVFHLAVLSYSLNKILNVTPIYDNAQLQIDTVESQNQKNIWHFFQVTETITRLSK